MYFKVETRGFSNKLDVGVKKEGGVSAGFSKGLGVTFGKASWKDGKHYWRGRFAGKN